MKLAQRIIFLKNFTLSSSTGGILQVGNAGGEHHWNGEQNRAQRPGTNRAGPGPNTASQTDEGRFDKRD